MNLSTRPLDLLLLPHPRSLTRQPCVFRIPAAGAIGIGGADLYPAARDLQALFPGMAIHAGYPGGVDAVALALRPDLPRDGYRLAITSAGIRIEAGAASGAFYAVQTLRQIVEQAPAEGLPCLEIEDWPDFADRGVYYDVTRGRVPKLERLLELADQLSRYKINQLQLYIEHTFAFRGHPDIGKEASPLTAEDILALDAHCRARHIELVPSLAAFGHLSTVLKHPQYHHLAEDLGVGHFVDPDAPRDFALHAWTLSPANPEGYAFLDSLFAEFLPLFSSDRFNACCDEVYDLGWGQSYELCKRRGKGRVYLDHLAKVAELAGKYGKRLMFWGDIIRHHPDLVPEIPTGVTVLDWAYTHTHKFDAIADFQRAGLAFYACPGTNAWISLFPRLAVARGNIAGFAAAGRKYGARGLLNTDWGDGGHYNFMEYSWHGYLFGAEQAWNTGADQASFTRRFTARFLGRDDAALAAAVDELGEIASLSGNGGHTSLWTDIFFGLPGDPVFRQPSPAVVIGIRDGRVATEPLQVDAALGRGMAARLGRMRAVLAACADDPADVLPYWVFAADTLLMAARRLAAFGSGGRADADERAALDADYRALRRRFVRLWRARNRPSEIGVTLARYDRVIRGASVVAELAEVVPGRIRLTVTNAGSRTAAGSVTLSVTPAESAVLVEAEPSPLAAGGHAAGVPRRLEVIPDSAKTEISGVQMRFSRLRPGASRQAEFMFEAAERAVPLTIRASGPAAGFCGAALTLYPARHWTLPQVGPDRPALAALPRLLAQAEPREARLSDGPVAEVRAALAGDVLAVVAQVRDVAVRRGDPVWRGSCFELFGCAGPGRPIGQIFLAPPAGETPAAAFRLAGEIVPAPEIEVAAVQLGPEGYTLAALVPLSLLCLKPGMREFLLDGVATACTAGRTEHRRSALFFSGEYAFRDSAGYGCVRVAEMAQTEARYSPTLYEEPNTMNHVERLNRVLNFQPVDRLPMIEWAGYWDQTLTRWQREGLPPEWGGDAATIREGLGLDPYRQFWLGPWGPEPGKALAEKHIPVRSAADYEALLPLFYPDPPFNADWLKPVAEKNRAGEIVVWLSLTGFFWWPRTLFGIEGHLMAFYDQPELMHRMNEDLLAFNLRVIDALCAIVQPSFMTFGEDLSYNHGPMLSKECFDEFLAPYYRRIVPVLKDHGILPLVDTDGMVEPLIPWFEEVGIEGCLPLERMAGVDVARIRRNHPRWRMIGGYDKTVMHRGEAAVRAEFERLLPVVRTGGFIPSVDHQTPPEVSLEDYRRYVELLHHYVRSMAVAHTASRSHQVTESPA